MNANTPLYEHPAHRFLVGLGELQDASTGRVFTSWEALLRFSEDAFPIVVDGEHSFSRELLLEYAAWYLEDTDRVSLWLRPHEIERLKQVIVAEGFGPLLPEPVTAPRHTEPTAEV